MGIFRVEKKDLGGKLVESFEMQNTILDAGLEYLCNATTNDFNTHPQIGVGSSDITPDTNQIGLISKIAVKTATFTPGTSTLGNLQGNKQFLVATHFNSNEAIGDLTELTYYMSGTVNPVPLNRTLFQVPGTLDTKFTATPELDQAQIIDISNVSKIYGTTFYDQTFTVSASGGSSGVTNLTELALSLASSGNPAFPLIVQLYSDNAGVPNALLATSAISVFSEPVQRWRIAKFNTVTVAASAVYHIVVSCPGTDAANSYDIFGSVADQYAFGKLSVSTNSGGLYAAVSPSQDLGFKTYYSTSGAVTHDYVVTAVQFDKETAQSADFQVMAFPENNLDSTNTTQGTVRLTLPTYLELPEFTSKIKVYKNVSGSLNLLATLGTVRQYFYDNGTVVPSATIHPPTASSIATPTGLSGVADGTNGGTLQLGQNKFYKISAVMQGPIVNSISVGPFVHPGVPGPQFYDNAYNTIPTPLYGAEYETAASGEFTLTSPVSAAAPFTEYFTTSLLNPAKWNITNDNSDYYSIVTPASTGESQLQMNVPAGVPFVVSSTRLARPGQSYYVNVQIPLADSPVPARTFNSDGTSQINPIFTDGAPNRVPLFSFVNPANVQTQSNDKRLTFEYGYYHYYRLEDYYTNGDQSLYAHGPFFALYDNVGNVYLFNTTDIPKSHGDSAYTFKIDILSDRSLKISVLNSTTRTFQQIASTVGNFNFKTQINGNHTVVGGAQPGPLVQTTDHFLVPENYSFAIGNPSNDVLSFAQANYIAVNDSIYTITGTSPTVPVPAIAMTVNGSITTNNGGFGATLTWNPVAGARRYRLYATGTSGDYTAANGNLVYDYETYFPAYAVQSTDTPNNDFQSALVAVGNNVRNWLDIGVSYGIDATSTGSTNSYALGGFVGSNSANYGNPLVPSIASSPGTAETYLLLLSGQQKALFTFMGGGFEIVSETGPDRGIGAIKIDGNFVQNVDFYSAERLEQQSVFRTDVLTPGYHTIEIQPTGTANDFSLGLNLALDYFRITMPVIVDSNNLFPGAPLTVADTHIASVPPPTIKSAKTYNGNGPTVVVKDPQHTLDVTMTFSLINPNL